MKATFEELLTVISTVMLLPAMLALILFGLRRRVLNDDEQWSPVRFPERNWWDEEEST